MTWKKFMAAVVIGLLLGVVTTPLGAAMTNSVAAPVEPTADWWSGGWDDTGLLFLREVETIIESWGLEGDVAFDDILFTPTDTPPTVGEGRLYFNDSANALRLYANGTWVTLETSAGNSLDTSYDAGVAITVDNGAVALTATDAANNTVLQLVQSDTATSLGLDINNAGTGNSIDIQGTGGKDIEGTDDSWNITYDGNVTAVAGTFSGDVQVTGAAVNINFDVSRNQLSFADNALLGIGGADNAAGDFTFQYDGSDLLMEAAAADDVWKLGATTNFDVIVYGDTDTDLITVDTSAELVTLNGFDLRAQDGDFINFGDSDDVTVSFDSANFEIFALAIDTPFVIGGTAAGFDVTYAFETAGQFRTDYDGDFINLTDGMGLRFGTGASSDGDFQISSGATNVLAIVQVAADTGTMTVGADGTDIPLTWYAETAGDFVRFTGDDLQLEDASLCLAEGTQIQFGDALGTGDVTISSTSNVLTIGQVAAGTGEVRLGVDDAGMDFTLFGNTASQKAWWDASGDEWFFGADAEGVDVTFYGDTASSYMKWDENGGTNGMLLVEAADIALGDGDQILLGDALGTGSFSIASTSAVLAITQVAADTGTITFGADGTDIPTKWFAETASDYLEFTGDQLNAVSINIVGSDSATLSGFLKVVTDDTNGKSLTIAESGTVQTNAGASGAAAWTLPAAAVGLNYTFVVGANFELRITPAAGDKINHAGTLADAAEYYWANATGESVTIVAIDSTQWVVTAETGTWTEQTP